MQKEGQSSRQFVKSHLMTIMGVDIVKPQLFTPNLKTIQNPCLSLDPGWFLFSPNGCFLLDKKEFPLYGISVEKNTKRKETHMNSLPNHHFQNKSFLPTIFRWRSFNPVWWSYLFSGTFFPVETKRADF
ncbi:putative transposase [Streptococcus pneumoniae 2082170]|nr:putative transposase [Streptococcus pneumoniae 2082170]